MEEFADLFNFLPTGPLYMQLVKKYEYNIGISAGHILGPLAYAAHQPSTGKIYHVSLNAIQIGTKCGI
jgi:hypothetical protein